MTILILTLALLASPFGSAQRISGEIRLQVVDMTGGALHASGRIVGQSAGVDRSFETDDMGRFALRGLPPGRYELTTRSEGFSAKTEIIQIESQLPLEHRVSLEVTPLSTTIDVKDVDTLLDPVQTAQYLSHEALEDRASSSPNRSVINLVNTQPGWLLEANGSLHPRGSEYDVKYVIDGVPLYDNRSPAFAQSVNVEEFQSLNVRTAGYPAEFGLKLGGVIETASDQDSRAGFHGAAGVQGGSFSNRAGSFSIQYGRGKTSFGLNGDAMATDRYLDPPVLQNYTNRGSGGGFSTILDHEWSSADRTRFYADHRNTRFMVPNELLQQTAGQRQDRDGGETLGQIAHSHVFSPQVLGQFRAMARDTNATLWSNTSSTPIRPAQDRGFREAYAAGSIAAHYGKHELKTGVESWFSSVREDLSFHIVNYRLGTVRIFDRDIPQDFHFADHASGRTQSAFVQDSWRVAGLTLNAGIRFDHYKLVADETAWSPRLGVAYEVPRAGLVLRGSYDRVFQVPAMENILLASSDLARTLGGGAFLPLRPSRGHFVEAGFSKSLSPKIRIDGSWYRRSFDNFGDDSLLVNTGVSFPIAFSEARVRGFESRIEVRSLGPFSGQVSYANMVGFGYLPVAGGLFLGDDTGSLSGTGVFPISQDQRNTLRSQVRFQPHPKFWFAFMTAYNSGLPFEIEGPTNAAFIAQQYGPEILRKVNYERGRILPSSSLDVSAGVEILHTEKARVRFQVDAFNIADRLNLINFAGVFSGTAIDAPRSFALRLRVEF